MRAGPTDTCHRGKTLAFQPLEWLKSVCLRRRRDEESNESYGRQILYQYPIATVSFAS